MTSNSDNDMRNTLRNCLEKQLYEFELLKSMYPEPNEIILFDEKTLEDIKHSLDNETAYNPSHLDFVLKLTLNNLKLEFCINLPSFYPNEEPDIYIRSNQLNRQQQTRLNTELTKYIKENHQGEVCLHIALSWLQENIDTFHTIKVEEIEKQTVNNVKVENFVRLWIFSHHIYNKRKREDVAAKAKELNLTGFCLPGKPGVICVEGLESDCKEWWKDIKSMNWKKIIIRKTETFLQSDQGKEQKFRNFEEIHFSNPSNKTKHADMSGFSKYMEENGLTEVFNDFFGLCNV